MNIAAKCITISKTTDEICVVNKRPVLIKTQERDFENIWRKMVEMLSKYMSHYCRNVLRIMSEYMKKKGYNVVRIKSYFKNIL